MKSKFIRMLLNFKKKLFYAHILIINQFFDEITNDNVNLVFKIIISSMSASYDFNNLKIKKNHFYHLMTSHMIHKICCKIKNAICYDKNNICIKHFFQITTKYHEFKSFVWLFTNASFLIKMCFEYFTKQYLNNFIQWIFVVEILVYINVEICTSIKSMIYFYKYIFKNFDFVDVFLQIIEIISIVIVMIWDCKVLN